MSELTTRVDLMVDILVWVIWLLTQLTNLPISIDPVAALLALAALLKAWIDGRQGQVDSKKSPQLAT